MLLLILLITVVIFGICVSVYPLQKGTTESGIITKFNRLVGKINEKNADDLKYDLLTLLNQYRSIKTGEFSKAKASLSKSIKALNEQEENLKHNLVFLDSKIKELVSSKSENAALGAELLYNKEITTEAIAKIRENSEKAKELLLSVNNKIEMFNVHYELKKSEINSLIARSVMVPDIKVDLKLDDLKMQLEDKIFDQETYAEVSEKMYNMKDPKLDEYVTKYQEMVKAN